MSQSPSSADLHPAGAIPARPLSKSSAVLLVLSASGMIALCYLFSLLAMLALLVMLALEFIVFVALLRFGLSRVVAPVIQRHAGLLALFGRSLWLCSGASYRIPLAREEAPRLFAILDRLAARLAIPLPREVLVEMSTGAWVELRGWRQGSKATRLGIGYDLLAGLDEAEMEAVLAHEMAHARLVRRGVKWWLNGGVARIANLTQLLSGRMAEFRAAKKNFASAELCLRGADSCTRIAARLVAAYSRQDEFEADHGAASLCGSAPLVTSLKKLHTLSTKTSRLGWHERVARLQQGDGYAAWLLEEINRPVATNTPVDAELDEVTDPYSTHPSIRDRIAALPPVESLPTQGSPAIGLLASPDLVAARLVTEIDRVAAIEEQKDLRKLRKWAGKVRSGAETRPLQALAIMLVMVGIVALLFGFGAEEIAAGLVTSALFITGGVFLYRHCRYKDTFELPRPTRAAIRAGLERLHSLPDLAATEKEIEAARTEAAKDIKAGKSLAEFHRAEAFAALADCDYLRAHVSARLGLKADNKSVPCALALAVAAGATRQKELVGDMIRFLRAKTGLRTPATHWGAAWAFYLVNDLATAEALFDELLKTEPDHPELHLLLAECAANRGKRHSTLAHARAAIAAAPDDREAKAFLFGALVDYGCLREAGELLATLPPLADEPQPLSVDRVRFHLLRRDNSAAAALAERLVLAAPEDAPLRIQLAIAYEGVRDDARAEELFLEASRFAHHPEATLALARIAGRAGRKDEARAHALAALDTKRPLGRKAVPPLNLFGAVIGQLLSLRGAPVPCRAWVGTFTGSDIAGPLANVSLLVFARSEEEAAGDLRVIADAVLPGNELTPAHVTFSPAPLDRQPAAAVIPGVQCVWP